MKTMIEKIFSVRILALLVAVCATSGAWAVTANFVWDSDFGTATKTGLDGKTYTLSLPDDSWLQENGTLKAGSGTKGAYISLKHNDVYNLAQGTKLSVLMEYANATAQSSAVPLYLQADAYFGLKTNGESLDLVGDGWGTTFTPVTTPTMSSTGYLLFVYPQGDGVARAFAASAQSGLSDSSAGGDITSLKYSNKYLQNIVLGGPLDGGNNVLKNFENLVVKRVAVFTSAISASDAASYSFPDYIATVTEADTPWSTVFPSWDDEADNSGKVVYLEIKEGASVTKTTALTAKELIVVGSGTLSLSNTVTASNGITIGSGATVALSGDTGSAITNYGTLNVNGCSVTGTIKNYGTIATSGTTSIQNASSQFYESGTLSVSGETTLRTANDTNNDAGGLRGRVIINENARLISNYSATPNYSASLTLDLYGELALGSGVRWVVGGSTTVNVYSGGSITGGDTTNGGLDWRAGGGVINAYATSTFTAGIRARGSQTITVNVVGSDVVFSAPIYDGGQRGTVTKAGAGTWKIENGTSYGKDIKNALAGSSGTVEIIAKSADYNFASKGSTFSGVLKLTNANNKQTRFDAGENSVCFAEGVRPELVMDSTATYFRSGAYNNTPLYVRDLSGKSGAVFDARYTSGPLTFILDTQQTKDTEYAGIFNSDGTRTFSLNVTGNNVGGVHTLTLSGVNTTTNTVTVSNYAKVKFSSNGKWANGIVVVGENGVLESQNSAAIAANLKVEEGATLKFASGVELLASNYDWTSVSTDESVNIDLSAVTPSATPVTLIASGVGVSSSKFKVTAAQRTATLSVDNGALKATFPNFWRDGEWLGSLVADDDATLYISQNSTLTVSEALSLGAVTVVKEGEGNVALTISGAGALTTEGWTIPEGVTVNTPASMSISGTVSGDGVLNIPANTTLAMDGVTCSAKVTVSGTLETSGTTSLSAANTSAAGSLIKIVSDTTTLASAVAGLSGDITIESGAVLTVGAAWANSQNYMFDHINPNGNSTITVHGTVNFGDANMWELGGNIKIKLYTGAALNGNNSDDYGGTLDWYGNGMVNVYGNASINCRIRTSTGANPTFDVAEGATLTISKNFVPQAQEITYYYQSNTSGGSLTKTGSGTLDLTAITSTKPLTINAGTVVAVTAPTTAVVNEAGVLKLTNTGSYKDDRTVNLSGITGTGTIRYNGSGWRSLPNSSGNVFADTLSVELEQASGVPIVANNTVIGSISGSKNLRSDLGSSGKTFTVKQAKDGVWSGSFHGGWDGLTKFVVQGGASSTGTLTLAGTTTADGDYTYDDQLEVASSGSVNLTGLWIGATTVDGTFGGTGNITGALTFNAGSTFKVWATDADGLVATGALTLPVSGKVTVDVSSLTIAANASKDLLTVGSGMNANKFSQVGNTETHVLSASGQTLKLIPIAATVTSSSGTTPYATLDEAIMGLAGFSVSDPDAYVTLVNATTSDLNTISAEDLAEAGIVYDDSDGTYGFAAAEISSTKYTTLAKAIAAAESSGDTVTLLRDTSAQNVSLTGKSITLDEDGNTFSGSFTGSGTLIMTALPKALASARWAAGWTGTLWLQNCSLAVEDDYDPIDFGNATSTLRLTGCTGGFNSDWNSSGSIAACILNLQDDGETKAFTITKGFPGYGFTSFAKLTGSGTLVSSDTSATSPNAAQCYRFGDASEFAGSIEIGASSTLRVVIGGENSSDTGSANPSFISDYRKIVVKSGASATIASGKTWTAPGGITVDGNLSVANTGALTGTIAGGGTITYATLPAAPTFGSWTGTVVLPANQEFEGQKLDDYGVGGSTVRLQGANTGWFYYKGTGNSQTVATTIEIPSEASLTVTGLSPSFANGFDKLIGEGTFGINITGNIDLSDGGYSAYFQLKDVSGFTGSLSATGAGIAISDIRIANSETGGKIIVAKDATVHAGATWTATDNIKMTGSATLTYDPGAGNTYTMSNAQVETATKDNTIEVKTGTVICNATTDGIKTVAFHVLNGGHLQIGTNTSSDSDMLGWSAKGNVGAVTVDKGGVLTFKSRETYTRNTTLNGGTIYLSSTQGSRGIDIHGGQTITVTDDSLIEATGSGSYIYLRQPDAVFDVAAGKVLTINASFTYNSNSANDFNKTGAGTVVVNGYSGDLSFTQPKGVVINAGTYELNAVQNSNGQTGAAANFYTVASGAKLKVGSTGQVNTSTLTLNDGSQLEFGVGNATLINASTVTFASGTTSVAFSSGVTPTDDTTLLTWSSAPDGTFTLADDAIAANFRLVKDGTGLKIAAIVKIDNTSSVEVGYIDASGAAVITNTVGTIALSSTTTTANFYPNSTEAFAFNGATGLKNYNVYVKYIDGNEVEQTQNIYGLFTLDIVDAQAGNYTLTLNPNGTAVVNEETIYLKPALRAGNSDPSPMAYTGEGDLKFNVKAIPGLYYAVKAYSSPACADGDLIGSGEAKQAISATVSPEAPAIGAATVQYYKVAVGLAEDEVSPTP